MAPALDQTVNGLGRQRAEEFLGWESGPADADFVDAERPRRLLVDFALLVIPSMLVWLAHLHR